MATVYSVNTFTVSDATGLFTLSFAGDSPGYLDEDHVKYYIGEDVQPDGSRTFPTPTTVLIDPVPAIGTIISFRRQTSPDTRLVDWGSGLPITETLLDTSDLQWLYLTQEAADQASIDITEAEAAAELARKWASELEDVEVAGGEFSAKHYQSKVGTEAADAAQSATDAETAQVAAEAAQVLAEAAAGQSEEYDYVTSEITTIINLPWAYNISEDAMSVYLNGIRQHYFAYTRSSSTTITLTEAVPIGTKILVVKKEFDAGGVIEGPTGPQGEKGDTGDTGATGAPGADGADGADGANGTGDMNIATYDPTTVSGDAFDMDNMAEGTSLILTAAERTIIGNALDMDEMVEGTDTKIMTAAERTNLGNQSGINTGDNFTARVDYYSSSTIVGWSSLTSGRRTIYYTVIGDLVFIHFHLEGTSDDTVCTFTLPYTSEASYGDYGGTLTLTYDNTVAIATPGKIILPGGSATVTLYSDMVTGVWTNSGGKIVAGQFWYTKA